MNRLEDVIMPPAPPHLQRRRESIIRFLSGRTAAAGLSFLAIAVLVGVAALSAAHQGNLVAAGAWLFVLSAAYLGIGTWLCAVFMGRLRLWGGAPLAMVIEAKAAFVRTWPFASTRLLRMLVFDRMTGGGLPSSNFMPRGY